MTRLGLWLVCKQIIFSFMFRTGEQNLRGLQSFSSVLISISLCNSCMDPHLNSTKIISLAMFLQKACKTNVIRTICSETAVNSFHFLLLSRSENDLDHFT